MSPIEHDPLEEPKEISLGLDQYQAVRLRRTTVERQGVRVLNVLHNSLLSREARSKQRATSALFETLSKS